EPSPGADGFHVAREIEHDGDGAQRAENAAAELTLDEIRAMCNDLIKAHGAMLPRFI
ncbi:MAG: hypothetical protein M1457_09470, partial [bacterium]|nr:hypothetical protein [bacterium]